jgi:hypothetical protein
VDQSGFVLQLPTANAEGGTDVWSVELSGPNNLGRHAAGLA